MRSPYVSGQLTFDASKVTIEPQDDGWAYLRVYQRTGLPYRPHRVCFNVALTDNYEKLRELFTGLEINQETVLVEYIEDATTDSSE